MRERNTIVRFILNNKLNYTTGIVFMLLGAYVQTLLPNILGKTIDILDSVEFQRVDIIKNSISIIAIAIMAFVCTFVWRNLIMRASRKLECTLRDELFIHMQKMSSEFYSKRKSGDLIAYAINDINAVRMTVGPATAMAVNGVALSIATIISMTRTVDFRLAVMCLIPVPFIVIFMLKMGKLIQQRFRNVQQCFGDISGRIQENIYGIRVIKAYAQEDNEVRNFESLNNKMKEANLSMVRLSSALSPVIQLSFSISFVANLIIGGNMVVNGLISLGDFVAFNTYLTMIMGPIMSIGRIINILQRGAASYKRLNEVMKIKPDINDGKAKINKEIKGDIIIKGLTFSYPNSDVEALKDININIPQGKTLGIIGKTGSGKTTLANLLLKLYNVENNKITVDGIDVNDYQLGTLRQAYGYVPQDNFLFHNTIKENIKFFKDIYNDDEINNSIKNSCIYESINNFPDKIDTVLGERGVNLSGGQKQRISIARALIKNPKILILDDSLSAVDTITEKKILNNFKSLRKDKTTIIIAHKISSIAHADEIVVLDNGCICERGTHKDLLEERGMYYEIYREQENKKRGELTAEYI